MKMIIKEFANMLNGMEYTGMTLTCEQRDIAVDNGFVVVSGASDDLIEFEGAITDETGVFNGGTVHIQVPYECDGQIIGGGVVAGNNGQKNVMTILVKWCEERAENGELIPWTYETSVPHETFNIYENGELYCKGIVFSINDIK